MIAFALYPVIDISYNATDLQLRLSKIPPPSKSFERSLKDQVIKFMKVTRPEENFSDGIRAYVGLLAAAEALHHSIFLIDEPEAFLHPTLTKSLARHLCEAAKKKQRQLIVATHSAEFVLGCLEALPNETKILRLTYNGEVATTRELPENVLHRIATTPLLRSTNSIQGIFHKSVIVCEGDSDRVLYQELIYRLQKFGQNETALFEDNLLICSHGWKSAYKIVGALRQVGIPSAYLFDFDTICLKKSDKISWKRSWNDILEIAVPIKASRKKLCKRIVAVGNKLSQYSRASLKKQGLSFSSLTPSDKDAADKLIRILEKRGIFVCPFGCLESSLVTYGISSSKKTKSNYVERALNGLGESPTEAGYIKPNNDEVWRMLRRIDKWIEKIFTKS